MLSTVALVVLTWCFVAAVVALGVGAMLGARTPAPVPVLARVRACWLEPVAEREAWEVVEIGQ